MKTKASVKAALAIAAEREESRPGCPCLMCKLYPANPALPVLGTHYGA